MLTLLYEEDLDRAYWREMEEEEAELFDSSSEDCVFCDNCNQWVRRTVANIYSHSEFPEYVCCHECEERMLESAEA